MNKGIHSYIKHESLGGILIIFASIVALILANSSLSPFYFDSLQAIFSVGLNEWRLQKPLLLWVNDGLMALFFLLIGLELKREVVEGQLSHIPQIVLPAVAALGGIIAPALIYSFFTRHDAIALHGWAIPTATDIAFALSMLSLLGSRIPKGLKIFLMTVAIFDDIAAIVIIAIFYSANLSSVALFYAALAILVLIILNKMNVKINSPYLLCGFILWVCVLKSGVHATLAGFILALTIPAKSRRKNPSPASRQLEKGLHNWVTYGILPLFALANAGISFEGLTVSSALNPMTLGIALGLFMGKQMGIFSFTWILVKLGWAKLPHHVHWIHLYGAALLCGIGFTMSLFISTLAFAHQPDYIILSRLGIFCGTVISAISGLLVLRFALR